jgi:hypothetical protein
MPQPVRTHWHTIVDLMETGDVWVRKPGPNSEHWSEIPGFKWEEFAGLIRRCSSLPKFCLTEEVATIVMTSEECHASLTAMRDADVLRLPFPEMIVEVPDARPDHISHTIICADGNALPDLVKDPQGERKFVAILIALVRDESGPYILLSPSIHSLGWVARDGVPLISFGAEAALWMPKGEASDHRTRDTYVGEMGPAARALFSALILTNTRGITKEIIETERLNRARAKTGKTGTPVPRHTLLRIAHAYVRSEGSSTGGRRSPRVHLRRGHTKEMPVGKGRTGRKLVYIPPVLVNWDGDEDHRHPSMEYDVRW